MLAKRQALGLARASLLCKNVKAGRQGQLSKVILPPTTAKASTGCRVQGIRCLSTTACSKAQQTPATVDVKEPAVSEGAEGGIYQPKEAKPTLAEPLAKNLFLGKLNPEFLVYPEISKEELEFLTELVEESVAVQRVKDGKGWRGACAWWDKNDRYISWHCGESVV
ncbi:hypothetical protein ElyMa_001521800 [Elysia marginata]|uniref:Uncharacterized protein n=1 Tax=Elysia marginata TaxID=1093978 RepID=A0AAV4J7N5_9GAST|nr:hypothetical protein ElyMa_001521800 [Elysia marginata]